MRRLHLRLFGTPRLLRRLVPGGLLGRSLLILVVPLILLQVITSIIFYDRHWDTVTRRLSDGVAGDVAAVMVLMRLLSPPPPDESGTESGVKGSTAGEGSAPGTDTTTSHPFLLSPERFPDGAPALAGDSGSAPSPLAGFSQIHRFAEDTFALKIDFQPGAVLPNSPPPDDGSLEDTLTSQITGRVSRPVLVEAGFFASDVDVLVQLPDGILHVTVPRKRLYSSTTYIFVMWMVGASMILFGIATIFMSNQVRSIRRLAESSDAFGKGQEVPPLKPEGAREVRQAAHAFNLMRHRIRRQVAQRTEMLAGVSHDLRTPLTRMKLQLAMMEDSPDIADLNDDLDEMQRMIDGYLAFARGEGQEEAVPLDLFLLVEDICNRFSRGADKDRLHWHVPEDEEAILPLRLNGMERCLSNIISNALRYGHQVHVSACLRERQTASPLARDAAGRDVEITVEDDGPGIPPDMREDVFRPFFRAEPSRNQETGGVGLGLTIARDVIQAHGGDLRLEDSSTFGGLRVTIHLPG